MRTPYRPRARRRVLCVSPRYAPSFGTFQYAYPFFGGRVAGLIPPQGLLVCSANMPAAGAVCRVDENIRPASARDLDWADAVLVSGMHVQRPSIEDIVRRAHARDRPVVLGGPSVSACPEDYPDVDVLHLGALGDATDRVIEWIDGGSGRPPRPLRLETVTRLPLADFPPPAYDLIPLRRYFTASVQFSSGCPYSCEFCDIPALYGRNPRLKTPSQVLAELDRIAASGTTAVYFVDDNFIGNQKAALELLPHLVDWQRRHAYPLRLACEATLNLAKNDRLLALMRDAGFVTVFCGIETPEPEALRRMSKEQNLRMPILDAVQRLNDHGLEVVSGIILGLDSDTPDTAEHIVRFVEASNIPILTINLLYALPRTPLWNRLEATGRLVAEPGRESNVVFALPYETVLGMWLRCITAAYAPDAIYRRFAHNFAHVVPKRIAFPRNAQRESWRNVLMGLGILRRIIWRVGVRSDYRRTFWRLAWPALRAGRVEEVIHTAVLSHHLIQFTRQCVQGAREATFYAPTAGRRVA